MSPDADGQAFFAGLGTLTTFRDALALVDRGPDRPYRSNLGFFLRYGKVPNGASQDECVRYERFVRRLGPNELVPGGVEELSRLLLAAAVDRI